MDLRWWPVPLLGWGLVDQLFPGPPAEHLSGQNQFILRLHNQLLHLATANFVFDFLDARGLKEIIIRYRPVLLIGWDTHGQDDLIAFSDQRFGVLPVGCIRWHLLDHPKDLVVKDTQGVVGIRGHGQPGQSSCLQGGTLCNHGQIHLYSVFNQLNTPNYLLQSTRHGVSMAIHGGLRIESERYPDSSSG